MNQSARPPIVTLILIAANILAAFGVLGFPDLVANLGFHSDAPTFVSALTSLFLHANVIHLLGNMIFLAAVGAAVEMASGSLRFACVYFASGLVGVGAHYLMTRTLQNPAPYVGASGCIAGCAGYYSFRYTGLKVAIWPGRELSVAVVTSFWVALQVVGAYVRIGDGGGTSYWAHLGGFAAGILLSLLFRAPDLGQTMIGHALIDKMSDRGPAAVVATAQRHLKTHPNDPKALDDIARAYGELDEVTKETDTLKHLLDVSPPERYPEVLRRLLDLDNGASLPCWKRTMLAEQLKDTAADVSRGLLQTVIDDADPSQRPEALLALAALERTANPSHAAELLLRLSREYPIHPAMDVARKRGWVS